MDPVKFLEALIERRDRQRSFSSLRYWMISLAYLASVSLRASTLQHYRADKALNLARLGASSLALLFGQGTLNVKMSYVILLARVGELAVVASALGSKTTGYLSVSKFSISPSLSITAVKAKADEFQSTMQPRQILLEHTLFDLF